MASMNQVSNRKDLYVIAYRDPYTNKRMQKYYKNKNDAVIALSHWQQIELYKKNNMDWESFLHKQKDPITIGEVFNAFTNNVLSTMTNVDTIAKYNTVMNSCRKVFPDNTQVNEIRIAKKHILDLEVTGWMIYKREMELIYGRSRRGIDSYLRDILHIFNWAFEEELIDKVVIKKSDRYKENELKPIEYKAWTDEEINDLFNHHTLNEFQKDIMWLFAVMGSRANELTGHNTRKPYKELHWEHVNFEKNTLQLLQKRRQIREVVDVHSSVIVILKKWKERGYARPLDMNYKTLNRKLHEIVELTDIEFTCHDLRRMKAQVLRKETHDLTKASRSIGDKTDAVVDNHYAGITIEEQRATNEEVVDKLSSIISNN
ncbi:site-specific recombinase XerD [uncultured Mediterranean phage uvMED]|nr:site-specific recombinase XerD [uncultured Mediterranean phage uvMED]